MTEELKGLLEEPKVGERLYARFLLTGATGKTRAFWGLVEVLEMIGGKIKLRILERVPGVGSDGDEFTIGYNSENYRPVRSDLKHCGDDIVKVRRLLDEYDRGEHSAAGLEGALCHIFLDEILKAIRGEEKYYASFSSCCCSPHTEPERVTLVEVREGPHHVIFKKVAQKSPGPTGT